MQKGQRPMLYIEGYCEVWQMLLHSKYNSDFQIDLLKALREEKLLSPHAERSMTNAVYRRQLLSLANAAQQ